MPKWPSDEDNSLGVKKWESEEGLLGWVTIQTLLWTY
jgi:hypothetical protein